MKSKTAARWRWCDVLDNINWQGCCWAISSTTVQDGLKMIAQSYTKFLEDNFIPWYRKQHSASFKKKIIFMQDNAPSHAARYTISFLAKFGFKDEKSSFRDPLK